MRYSEFRQKEVVNILDGHRLGAVIDLEFNPTEGRLCSITVQGPMKVTKLIRGDKCGVDIPWHNIVKIGDDVILVEVDPNCFRLPE